MATMNSVFFDPKCESIGEFCERFKVQNSDTLEKAGEDGLKKASILIKCLPVNVITQLQRKLQPTKLSEAEYDVIISKLTSQYEVKKSIVGASVRFINKKQSAGESIENYARTLNMYANDCNYKSCCMDRLLRDTFVAGVRDSAILTSLLGECDKDKDLKFESVVEKAKVLEQLRVDAQIIKGENVSSTFKLKSKSSDKVSPDYKCYRCLSKGLHLAQNCFALNLTCHSCMKKGHIKRACNKNLIKMLQCEGEEENQDEVSSHCGSDAGSVIGHLRGPARGASTNHSAPNVPNRSQPFKPTNEGASGSSPRQHPFKSTNNGSSNTPNSNRTTPQEESCIIDACCDNSVCECESFLG